MADGNKEEYEVGVTSLNAEPMYIGPCPPLELAHLVPVFADILVEVPPPPCPSNNLHQRGVFRWCDLVGGKTIPAVLVQKLAPTWQAVYKGCVQEVLGMYAPLPASPLLDTWAQQWSRRSMLLFLQHRTRPEARQPPEVWRIFRKLCLPKWDLDFVGRVLWRKLPLRVRMERLGEKQCPLDGKVEVEDHAHVLKNCDFSVFTFDTVRKAFRLVEWEGRRLEPSRLLLKESAVSLQCTQGLVLWAALKAQWKIHCASKY